MVYGNRSGSALGIRFGDSSAAYTAGELWFKKAADTNENHVRIGFYNGNEPYRFYPNRSEFNTHMTINTNNSTQEYGLALFNNSQQVGHMYGIIIGKSNADKCRGDLRYVWADSYSDRYMARFYPSKIVWGVSNVSSSDARLKENIEELPSDDTSIIDNVKVYSFNMVNDQEELEVKRKHYGVLAHELQELDPNLVFDDGSDDHYLSVNYTELIPHLINKT